MFARKFEFAWDQNGLIAADPEFDPTFSGHFGFSHIGASISRQVRLVHRLSQS
jgi:hypothetical protein